MQLTVCCEEACCLDADIDEATSCALLAEAEAAWAWLAVAVVATSEAALAIRSAEGSNPLLLDSLARLEDLAYLEDNKNTMNILSNHQLETN